MSNSEKMLENAEIANIFPPSSTENCNSDQRQRNFIKICIRCNSPALQKLLEIEPRFQSVIAIDSNIIDQHNNSNNIGLHGDDTQVLQKLLTNHKKKNSNKIKEMTNRKRGNGLDTSSKGKNLRHHSPFASHHPLSMDSVSVSPFHHGNRKNSPFSVTNNNIMAAHSQALNTYMNTMNITPTQLAQLVSPVYGSMSPASAVMTPAATAVPSVVGNPNSNSDIMTDNNMYSSMNTSFNSAHSNMSSPSVNLKIEEGNMSASWDNPQGFMGGAQNIYTTPSPATHFDGHGGYQYNANAMQNPTSRNNSLTTDNSPCNNFSLANHEFALANEIFIQNNFKNLGQYIKNIITHGTLEELKFVANRIEDVSCVWIDKNHSALAGRFDILGLRVDDGFEDTCNHNNRNLNNNNKKEDKKDDRDLCLCKTNTIHPDYAESLQTNPFVKMSLINLNLDESFQTALHWSVFHGRTDMVKYFLENSNLDANLKISHSISAMDFISPTNLITINDEHVLSFACSRGFFEIVKLLLENEANPNPKIDCNGGTPLLYAIQKGYPHIVELLIKAGSKISDCGDFDAYPLAIELRHFACAEVIENYVISVCEK